MKLSRVSVDRYDHIVVPLGFTAELLRSQPLSKIERWGMVFVGTSGRYHDMKLIIDAVSHLVEKFPSLRVHIIGPGRQDDTRRAVMEAKLEQYFVFEGFVATDEDLFSMVSRFAVGIAPYAVVRDNPTIYADPGKPKLYAFCGLPIIITRVPFVAEEIAGKRAGVAVGSDSRELAAAIELILASDETLKTYRDNAVKFAKEYTSERIFDVAFERTLNFFGMGRTEGVA
jgi:glycosyltransferase involved in cell wall biosynthesis